MASRTNTRERLLDAAIAVLETHGEAAIRVDELAKVVGVAKPSIYHFFGSREGLVAAALAEMYRRTLSSDRELLLELARSATTREQFVDSFRSVVASYSSEDGVRRRAFRTEVLGAAVSRPELQDAIVEMHREQVFYVVEFLMLGQERGFLSAKFDLHTSALWATAVILGRHFAEIDPSADRVTWDKLTTEALIHLLFGDVDT